MIPVVDISPFFDDSANRTTLEAVGKEWDHAMSEFGFAVVIGHGIPEDNIRSLRDETLRFFSGNSVETKSAFNHGPYGHPLGGYTGLGVEAVQTTWNMDTKSEENTEAAPDLVENYVFRDTPDLWLKRPADCGHPGELEALARPYVEKMVQLSNVIHRVSAIALGLDDEAFFDKFFNGPKTEYSLRLAYYPPLVGQDKKLDDIRANYKSIRYGAHTDYTGYTLLVQGDTDQGNDESGGLQVLIGDGEKQAWTYVQQVPNSFIVNAGDLWQVWSNARWKSAVHRVTNPSIDSEFACQARVSIPFFTGPHMDALVEPIIKPGEVAAMESIVAEEHLHRKLNRSNVG